MREFKDWYVWLTSHPKAGKWLLGHFTQNFVACDIGVVDAKLKVFTLPLNKLPYNAESAAAWIKKKLTREKCERVLVDLGYTLVDTVSAEVCQLRIEPPPLDKQWMAVYDGESRWEVAVQWALEKWEKAPPSHKAMEGSPPSRDAMEGKEGK